MKILVAICVLSLTKGKDSCSSDIDCIDYPAHYCDLSAKNPKCEKSQCDYTGFDPDENCEQYVCNDDQCTFCELNNLDSEYACPDDYICTL